MAQDSEAAADRLIDRLQFAGEHVASSPLLGRTRPDIAADLRYWRVASYLILYRIADGGIDVVGYYHGRRDLRALLSEDR